VYSISKWMSVLEFPKVDSKSHKSSVLAVGSTPIVLCVPIEMCIVGYDVTSSEVGWLYDVTSSQVSCMFDVTSGLPGRKYDVTKVSVV